MNEKVFVTGDASLNSNLYVSLDSSMNGNLSIGKNIVNRGTLSVDGITSLNSEVFIAGDEEKKKEAKNTVIYGVIGLFVMVSIWGLVNILDSTLGLNGTASQTKANTNQLPEPKPLQ